MKKREQGVLTVEASIVLSLCLLFILFLFSFARVYNAQSTVSHAVLQASDAVALESYLRETTFHGSEADVIKLANRFTGSTSLTKENFTSLRSADVVTLAKEKFVYAVGNTESVADEKLKKLGVKDGLSGVDFSASRIDLGNDDIIVYARYVIKMQFPVFGMSEIEVTKAAKSKTFGDILFGIETIPDDANKGSALGGGSYKYGEKVQISAKPNYGYKFVKWSDGSTAATRTVTVTGSTTYVAYFTQDEFGITVKAAPEGAGSVGGGGKYKYLSDVTISASANPGYSFSSWSVFKHNDKKTDIVKDNTTNIIVDQSYTCTANFKKNSYTVSVATEGAGDVARIIYKNQSKKSITAEYQTGFQLYAPDLDGYEFKGWKESGSNYIFSKSYSYSASVPAKDTTYVAVYNVKPSIKITGGETEVNSTKLKAITVPENVTVTWKSSDSGIVSVDKNGKITAKDSGTVTITASFNFDGKSYKATKKITTKPSITMEYYCRRDGFCSYSNSKCTYGPSWWKSKSGRRYINDHNTGMRFYYDYYPGPNALDPVYGDNGVFHGKLDVTWSQINGATTVKVQKKLTRSMIVHDTATTGPYAGVVNPQVGYNAGTKTAYIFYNGNYDALWYIQECHAPHPNGGYYDYYIYSIK